jgi:hypothetical protein
MPPDCQLQVLQGNRAKVGRLGATCELHGVGCGLREQVAEAHAYDDAAEGLYRVSPVRMITRLNARARVRFGAALR